MAHLVLPVASRALLESCTRLGLDDARLLAAAGIAPGALRDPDARLTAEQADALWRAAFEASRRELLALQAAEATPFGAFRVLDYLGATGPTLGDGLRLVAAYFPLVDPRGLLRVEEGRREVAVVFASAEGAVLPRPAQEYTLAVLLGRARHAAARPIRPAAVRFTFERPSDAREHVRIMGVEPAFGQREAALVFTREDWATPSGMNDPGLFSVLGAHARALATSAPAADPFLARVRAAIAEGLHGRVPALADTARRLALSPRTLQRRLAGEGTSHADLLSEVRRVRAEAYLRAGDVSISEVSWLLGFSEQSAFTRAFRRWTGQAPTALRRGTRR